MEILPYYVEIDSYVWYRVLTNQESTSLDDDGGGDEDDYMNM